MEEPEYVTIYDIESGAPMRVTKEYRDKYLQMFEAAMPKLTDKHGKLYGKLFMYGTGGDMDGNDNHFYELFYTGKQFKTNIMKEKVSELRFRVDAMIIVVSSIQQSAEVVKCLNSLKMAKAWLGKLRGALGEATPYQKDGKRQDVKDIEKTNDAVNNLGEALELCKKILVEAHTEDFNTMNHVQQVDYIRQQVAAIVKEFDEVITMNMERVENSERLSKPGTVEEFHFMAMVEIMAFLQHIAEARFWLGFELQRLREAEVGKQS